MYEVLLYGRQCRRDTGGFATITKVDSDSTFALRSSNLDFCLGGQRSLNGSREAEGTTDEVTDPVDGIFRDLVLLEELDLKASALVLCELEVLEDQRDEHSQHLERECA